MAGAAGVALWAVPFFWLINTRQTALILVSVIVANAVCHAASRRRHGTSGTAGHRSGAGRFPGSGVPPGKRWCPVGCPRAYRCTAAAGRAGAGADREEG